MKIISAGLILYTIKDKNIKVFLVKNGGPYYFHKEFWCIPKGQVEDNEALFTAAMREFHEETGINLKFGNIKKILQLNNIIKQRKIVNVWAVMTNGTEKFIKSNTFEMEWPKGSGKIKSFPEIAAGDWFDLDEAIAKINEGERNALIELKNNLLQ